jgi:hypothetical protein
MHMGRIEAGEVNTPEVAAADADLRAPDRVRRSGRVRVLL